MGFSRQEYGVGCHSLLYIHCIIPLMLYDPKHCGNVTLGARDSVKAEYLKCITVRL